MQLPPGAVVIMHPDAVLRAEVDNYLAFAIAVHVSGCYGFGAYTMQLLPGLVIIVYPYSVEVAISNAD